MTRELEQKSMWCASEFVNRFGWKVLTLKRASRSFPTPANTDGGEDDSRHLVKPLTPSREPGTWMSRHAHALGFVKQNVPRRGRRHSRLWRHHRPAKEKKKKKNASVFSSPVASRATRGVIKIDVSNPYAIWANTTDSGIVGVIDHIIAEKAATLITCADPNAECAHCMNVDSEFVASVLTKRLLDRTPKARNTLLKWG